MSPIASHDLDLDRDGAAYWPGVLPPVDLERLRDLADRSVARRPGARLQSADGLDNILGADGSIGRAVTKALGPNAQPVRAVMFDKTTQANWAVAWHQDRTIAVRERVEVDGYGPWSRKDGGLHVAPPFHVLEQMLTVRVHLDDCGEGNAPLRIALGSHRVGSVAATKAASTAAALTNHICLARAGDVWVYQTPILHASSRAANPSRRRVLQVDFAAQELDGGLRWSGLTDITGPEMTIPPAL